jgi:uncharacterized protein YjaZ
MKEHIFFINNHKAKIYCHVESTIDNNNRKNILNTLLASYQNIIQDYSGFGSRTKLTRFLEQEIFGFNNITQLENKKIDNTKIISIIHKTLEKCNKKIAFSGALHIHCFPSYNSFINTKMSGVSGYTSDQNNILLFLSPQPGWQKQLRYTIAHEYAHTFTYAYHGWKTLLDSLIFEGIAEHFRESVLGGKVSPWSKSIPPNECKKIFKEIYNNLQNTQEKYYQQIFLGFEDKYPLWAGYAIGYQIVKLFLSKHKNMSWPDIVKTKTEDILTKSQYK